MKIFTYLRITSCNIQCVYYKTDLIHGLSFSVRSSSVIHSQELNIDSIIGLQRNNNPQDPMEGRKKKLCSESFGSSCAAFTIIMQETKSPYCLVLRGNENKNGSDGQLNCNFQFTEDASLFAYECFNDTFHIRPAV